MSFLDDYDLTDPLFEEVDPEELARQEDEVKKLGQVILAEEAQTGQRSENRNAALLKAIDPYEYLVSRGKTAVDVSNMNPDFVGRLASALQEAETASNDRALLNSGYRDRATQANLYARYRRGEGGLAARPGYSRHEKGEAADIARGKVLDWLHQNRAQIAQKYNIDFLTGNAFERDKVHIQNMRPDEIAALPKAVRQEMASAINAAPDESEPEWPEVVLAQGQSGETFIAPEPVEPLPPKPVTELTTEEMNEMWQRITGQEQPMPKVEPELSLLEKAQRGAGAITDKVTQPLKQFAGNALGTAASIPHNLMATVLAPQALIERGVFGRESTSTLIQSLQNTGNEAREAGKIALGANKPENFIEELAAMTGKNFVPMGAATLPMMAASSAVDFGVNHILTPATAANSKKQIEAAAAKREAKKAQFEDDVDRVVETIGGPARVSNAELMTLGGMAAISMGAIFAPMIFSKFKTGRVPKLRAVEDAAPGTVALSRNADLARTADDANRGVLNIAKRAGLSPHVMAEVEKSFGIQTRTGATSIADAAARYGEAHTPNFSFKAKVPLAKLAEANTPQMHRYLNLRHMADELLLRNTAHGQLGAAKRAQAGTPNINGMTLQDVFREIHQIEQATPGVKTISAGWNDNLKAMRKFEATGEYSTLSKKAHSKVNSERPNNVPYAEHQNMDTSNPFQALADTMRNKLRRRMENEAVGKYIDEVRKVEPNMFVRVTREELKDNPAWKKNVVTMYRRGKPEHYTTDPFLADMLKMDPYYITSAAKGVLGGMKDVFQKTTTGTLAPFFATTSMLRAWQQAKFSADSGFKTPGLIGSVTAVPKQLYPQLAKHIAEKINNGSNGWVSHTLGQSNANALSLRLAKAYDDSLYARLQRAGSFEGSMWMQDYKAASSQLTSAIETVKGPAHTFLRGYKATLDAIHNGPMFDFAIKNQSKVGSTAELAWRSRNLTGNPRVGGQYYVGSSAKEAHGIRMEGTNPLGHFAAKNYALATEFGRESIPWFNVIQQSIKKTGESYLANPAKFVGKAWLYSAMPAAAEYFYTRALGNDPNGNSYADYMINGRNDQDRLLNWYIPIPGRAREDAIRVPTFQELSGIRFMMHTALDHLSRSSVFSESEDFMRAASAFGGVTISPPVPPIVNLGLASQGMTGLYGFGDDSYRRRQDPYDQTGGMPHSLELMTRALVPGLADIVGSGYAAMSQTPDDESAMKAFANGLKEMGTRTVKKTAVVRDVFGMSPAASGVNAITQELFKKDKAIKTLNRYFKDDRGKIGEKESISKFGGAVAEKILGEPVPRENAGLSQPEPTNPLYKMIAEEIYKKFQLDAARNGKGEEQGGMGYRSLWKRYGDSTAQIRTLRNINSGNYGTWQKQLADRPEQLKYLKENNIDYKDPKAVHNHYERVRQDAAKVILNTIKHVERDFSQRLGREIKLEDIEPYGSGLQKDSEELATRNY